MSALVIWTIVFHLAWLFVLVVWWMSREPKRRRGRASRPSNVYAARLDELERNGPVP